MNTNRRSTAGLKSINTSSTTTNPDFITNLTLRFTRWVLVAALIMYIGSFSASSSKSSLHARCTDLFCADSRLLVFALFTFMGNAIILSSIILYEFLHTVLQLWKYPLPTLMDHRMPTVVGLLVSPFVSPEAIATVCNILLTISIGYLFPDMANTALTVVLTKGDLLIHTVLYCNTLYLINYSIKVSETHKLYRERDEHINEIFANVPIIRHGGTGMERWNFFINSLPFTTSTATTLNSPTTHHLTRLQTSRTGISPEDNILRAAKQSSHLPHATTEILAEASEYLLPPTFQIHRTFDEIKHDEEKPEEENEEEEDYGTDEGTENEMEEGEEGDEYGTEEEEEEQEEEMEEPEITKPKQRSSRSRGGGRGGQRFGLQGLGGRTSARSGRTSAATTTSIGQSVSTTRSRASSASKRGSR